MHGENRRGRMLGVGAALAAALLLAPPVRAQQTAPHSAQEHQEHSAQHLDQMLAHMTSELGLSADQATRIRGIMERTMEQFQSVHAAHAQSGHEGGPPAEARALHERAMQQVDEVLTPDQRTRFHAMMEQMHGEHGQHAGQEHQQHDAQHLDQMLAHMTSELRLSADQATRIRAIVERTMEQFQAMHAAHAQSGHEGQPPAEVRALHERAMQQVEEVLTPDQRTRFRALMEQMHGEHGQHAGPAAPPHS